MSRLQVRFDALRANPCKRGGRKALVPFVCAGDPSLEATVPVMHALVAAGADVIELGIPFSDPMADGPTIQRSYERALARGAGLDYVLQCVRDFRGLDQETPVVLMGYLNPVEIHGLSRFAEQAAGAGVDGVLLVDLPPEEAGEFRGAFDAHALDMILLAAPTSSDARITRLCADAQGYLYYVNFAGVTGAAQLDTNTAGSRLDWIRAQSRVPVVAGFGIKDGAAAAQLAARADGVVVGSALVETLADATGPADAAARAGAFLAPLRIALDEATETLR